MNSVKIGEGSQARVCLGILNKELVAVKIGDRKTLEREIEAFHRLQTCSSVVPIYSIMEFYYSAVRNEVHITMELAACDLLSCMEAGILPGAEIDVCQQLMAGLGKIHALDFVHGDIKPDNIGVMYDGTVKYMDFGHSDVYKTKSKEYGGTVAYAHPDKLACIAFDNVIADTWSLAVCVFGLIFHHLPYRVAHRSDHAHQNARPLSGESTVTRIVRYWKKESVLNSFDVSTLKLVVALDLMFDVCITPNMRAYLKRSRE